MTQQPDKIELRPSFPALDTLRAMGALAVLTTHTAFQAGDYVRHGVVGTILARLDVGVAIFFVLSGFLLSRPYLARAALGLPRTPTLRYYEKRFLRIVPVYVVTVAIALMLVPGNDPSNLRQWVTTLAMADVYTGKELPHGLTHMWSLAAEVAFYVTLPAVMLLVTRGRHLSAYRLAFVLAAMVALSVTWQLSLEPLLDTAVAGAPGIWLPAYLTWFAAGIALAWVHVLLQSAPHTRLLSAVPKIASMPGICWSLVAGLMLIVATPVAGPTLFQVGTAGESLSKHLIYAAIGTLVVATGIWTAPAGAYLRVMTSRVGRHLGHISYSIFCIHLAVISLVMWLTGYQLFYGHGVQIWLLTVIITLLAAEVLYRSVERPCLHLKRRVPRPSAATTPTTTDTASQDS